MMKDTTSHARHWLVSFYFRSTPLFVLDCANISSKQYPTKPDQTRPYQTRLEECCKYTHLSSVQVGSVEDVRSQDSETQVNYFASFLINIVYLSQKCLKTPVCSPKLLSQVLQGKQTCHQPNIDLQTKEPKWKLGIKGRGWDRHWESFVHYSEAQKPWRHGGIAIQKVFARPVSFCA